MVTLALSAARLLLALGLVLLNGFFVAAEFAFVRIRSTTVDQLVEQDRRGSGALADAMASLDDYLAVTQLGITIASLGLGWVGEPAVAALIEPVLESVLPESAIRVTAFAIGFGSITFLHVVFGELAPKTIAIQEAERIALLVAPPMKLFYYLFVPGIVVFNGTANAVTRLLGVPPASESEETLGEEELRLVLARAGRQGEVAMEEVEMIEQVFELDDIVVRDVMVPRPDVVTIAPGATVQEVRATIIDGGHTRYPVVDPGDDDRIVGFVDAKDVLRAGEADDPGTVTAGDLARELALVPESSRVDELLATFQDERNQMAAVIDEWGAFEGIVTVEDVVEVIVGDIRDEFDADEREPSIERLDDEYVVDGGVPIAEVNDRLDATLESDAFGTIGGLVLDLLGRAPEAGDEVVVDGYQLTVDGVDGARIESVVIRDEHAESA